MSDADRPEDILTDEEMTRWDETLRMMQSSGLGRAHEMLILAIAEIRRHRDVMKRLDAWAKWLEGSDECTADVAQRLNRSIAQHLRGILADRSSQKP